ERRSARHGRVRSGYALATATGGGPTCGSAAACDDGAALNAAARFHQIGDHAIGDRRSQTGDEVVAWPGRVSSVGRARYHRVEIRAREAVQVGKRIIAAVEGSLARERPALVRDGEESRPYRRADARAAHLEPPHLSALRDAGVDINAGIRIADH